MVLQAEGCGKGSPLWWPPGLVVSPREWRLCFQHDVQLPSYIHRSHRKGSAPEKEAFDLRSMPARLGHNLFPVIWEPGSHYVALEHMIQQHWKAVYVGGTGRDPPASNGCAQVTEPRVMSLF